VQTGDTYALANGASGFVATNTVVDSILVDTNELQTDWSDGGRLDLLLDAAGAAGDPWATLLPGAYGAGTAGKIVGDNINAPLDTIDSVVDSILVDTAEIGAAGAGLTAVPWNASWDAEVQSEVQDAIEVNHLDHLLAVDYDPASKPGTSTALLNELIGDDGGVSQFTSNALENATSATAAAIADAVWDEVHSEKLQPRLPRFSLTQRRLALLGQA
jgi:hypothetical protein